MFPPRRRFAVRRDWLKADECGLFTPYQNSFARSFMAQILRKKRNPPAPIAYLRPPCPPPQTRHEEMKRNGNPFIEKASSALNMLKAAVHEYGPAGYEPVNR
jgi:hypothetical protein